MLWPKNIGKGAKIDLWVNIYSIYTADSNFIILQVIKKQIGSFGFSVKPRICTEIRIHMKRPVILCQSFVYQTDTTYIDEGYTDRTFLYLMDRSRWILMDRTFVDDQSIRWSLLN